VNTSVPTVENNGKVVELELTSDKNARNVPNKLLHIIWRNSINAYVCRANSLGDGNSLKMVSHVDRVSQQVFAKHLIETKKKIENTSLLIDCWHSEMLMEISSMQVKNIEVISVKNANTCVDRVREREILYWPNRVDQLLIFGHIRPSVRTPFQCRRERSLAILHQTEWFLSLTSFALTQKDQLHYFFFNIY
jgi:hypothetical protein